MSDHIQRAQLLLQHERFPLAEEAARQALAEDPDDPIAHAFLALALAGQKKLPEATQEAQAAVHLAPDLSYAHYVLAHVLDRRDHLSEAEAAINEAIRLDPEDPDYFGLLAGLHSQHRRWKAALQAAEYGLRLDAEHGVCANLRALALVHLGRRDEAGATIDAALARAPEDALTHANQGWTLLHQGNPQRAMEHFREALRLEPGQEWARAGIVEALKARHFLYGLMLRYFLWMSRFGSQQQWGIIVGGYIAFRVLGGIARSVPAARPFLLPVIFLYLLFAFLTWVADPLFNLILRLNRFGRLALSHEQMVASNWFGGAILAGVLLLGAGILLANPGLIIGAPAAWLLLLPLSAVFRCAQGWPRLAMGAYTGLVAAAAVTGTGLLALKPAGAEMPPLVATCAGLTLMGAVFSTWAGNILGAVTPRK